MRPLSIKVKLESDVIPVMIMKMISLVSRDTLSVIIDDKGIQHYVDVLENSKYNKSSSCITDGSGNAFYILTTKQMERLGEQYIFYGWEFNAVVVPKILDNGIANWLFSRVRGGNNEMKISVIY